MDDGLHRADRRRRWYYPAMSGAPPAWPGDSSGAIIGESPLWLAGERRVLWTAPLDGALLSARRDAPPKVDRLPTSQPVWSLALATGALVGTLDAAFCTIDADRGAISAGPPAPLAAGCRFNDMAVDASGGLWSGSMHRGLLSGRGGLFCAPAPEAGVRQVAGGLGVANGMGFSLEQDRLFVVDTLARTLLSYPVDIRRGELGEPTVVTDFLGLPGKPDGLTVAPDGTIWVAMWGGSCVVAIGLDGALLGTVAVPAPHVSSLCVDDDGVLLVATSRMRLNPDQLASSPLSGSLIALPG